MAAVILLFFRSSPERIDKSDLTLALKAAKGENFPRESVRPVEHRLLGLGGSAALGSPGLEVRGVRVERLADSLETRQRGSNAEVRSCA